MKRNMQIESVTRSTFCATNITNTIMDATVDKIVLFSVGGVVTLILCAFGYSFLIRGIKKY